MHKMIQKAKKNQKGFTLVELMVVEVIIGVLVAIAVPIYGNVQLNARINAHNANVRTLQGAAAIMFSENAPLTVTQQWRHNDTVPTSATGREWQNYVAQWPNNPFGDTLNALLANTAWVEASGTWTARYEVNVTNTGGITVTPGLIKKN